MIAKWVVCMLTGLMTGALAFVLDFSADQLYAGKWKLSAVRRVAAMNPVAASSTCWQACARGAMLALQCLLCNACAAALTLLCLRYCACATVLTLLCLRYCADAAAPTLLR